MIMRGLLNPRTLLFVGYFFFGARLQAAECIEKVFQDFSKDFLTPYNIGLRLQECGVRDPNDLYPYLLRENSRQFAILAVAGLASSNSPPGSNTLAFLRDYVAGRPGRQNEDWLEDGWALSVISKYSSVASNLVIFRTYLSKAGSDGVLFIMNWVSEQWLPAHLENNASAMELAYAALDRLEKLPLIEQTHFQMKPWSTFVAQREPFQSGSLATNYCRVLVSVMNSNARLSLGVPEGITLALLALSKTNIDQVRAAFETIASRAPADRLIISKGVLERHATTNLDAKKWVETINLRPRPNSP
jgi:hypothetical protein